MNRIRTAAALATAGALVAVPLTLAAGAAQADTERSGALAGGGRYELSVDREDGRFEVTVDVDDAAPGARYAVVLRQDGKRFVKQTLTADGEGDVDLERLRPDTAGTDRFALVLKPAAGGKAVRAVVTR